MNRFLTWMIGLIVLVVLAPAVLNEMVHLLAPLLAWSLLALLIGGVLWAAALLIRHWRTPHRYRRAGGANDPWDL